MSMHELPASALADMMDKERRKLRDGLNWLIGALAGDDSKRAKAMRAKLEELLKTLAVLDGELKNTSIFDRP